MGAAESESRICRCSCHSCVGSNNEENILGYSNPTRSLHFSLYGEAMSLNQFSIIKTVLEKKEKKDDGSR